MAASSTPHQTWHGTAWHGMACMKRQIFSISLGLSLFNFNSIQFNSISFFIIISDLDPDLIGIVIVPGGVWGISIVSNL